MERGSPLGSYRGRPPHVGENEYVLIPPDTAVRANKVVKKWKKLPSEILVDKSYCWLVRAEHANTPPLVRGGGASSLVYVTPENGNLL